MADFSIHTHKVLINGVPIEGFSNSDDAISLTPSNDFNDFRESADGIGYSTQIQSSLYDLSLKIMDESSSNQYLNGLYNAGKVSGNINITVLIIDFNGRGKFASSKAVIVRPAAISRGTHATVRDWTIRGQFDVVEV